MITREDELVTLEPGANAERSARTVERITKLFLLLVDFSDVAQPDTKPERPRLYLVEVETHEVKVKP